MPFEVQVFAQVLTIVAVFTSAMVGLFFVARSLWHRTSRSALPAARVDDDRFHRLEEAVDTIAVEIERISEAQRFAAKLLLERGADAAQSKSAPSKLPERIITPR
jgi:hypothetical protein